MSNPSDNNGKRPPVVGRDTDFDAEASTGQPTGAGHGHNDHAQQTAQKVPLHKDEDRLNRLFPWLLALIVVIALMLFTPIGWIIGIVLVAILCIAAFVAVVGGSAGKHAGGDAHGHDEHGHDAHGHADKAHGAKNGAELVIHEADDLGIVNPPPETSVKAAGFGLYTIREDSVLVFYDSWFKKFYPNGDGARERLPASIRDHIPPGRWVEVPIVCILRGRLDMSTKLVGFTQTIKIKNGRTVTVEGTAYVRAKQTGGTISAGDMRKLMASFDGSKQKLVITALQGALDKATMKFAPKDLDGQLQSAAHGIEGKVSEELAKYGLDLENLHFDTVEDPAEQAAGEIERMQETGTIGWAMLDRGLKALEAFANRGGGGGNKGGQSGGNNKKGGRGKQPGNQADD